MFRVLPGANLIDHYYCNSTTIFLFERLENIKQSLPQAPVAPGSVLRRDGNPNADGDPAGGDYSSNNISNNNNNEPGDSNSNNKPGGSSSVSPGGGSRSYLKPCSAVSPGSSLSAPLCDMSPHRMARSPSKSRPPFSQDILAATKKVPPLVVRSRSQSNIAGGKARGMFGKGLTRRHSFPFAIGEGTAKQERMGLAAQAGGVRGFNMAFAATSSAAPSPGVASPPKLRGARGFNRAALLAALEASSPSLASPPRLLCAKAGGGPSGDKCYQPNPSVVKLFDFGGLAMSTLPITVSERIGRQSLS